MIRLTELRLPLDHADAALRAAIVARLGIDDAALRGFTVFERGYDARKKAAIVFVYTRRLRGRRRGRGARPARRRRRTSGRRPTRATASSRQAPADFARGGRPRPVVVGFGPCGIFAALRAGADGPSPDRPRARQRGARAHPGHLGPVAPRRARSRSRTCSSAKAAPARSPTASCGARSATRATSRARCSTSSSRPARRRRSSSSPSRTSAPSAWSAWSRRCAPRSSALGGEIRFGSRVVDLLIEAGAMRGLTRARPARDARSGDERDDRRRARRARARPQRARHLRDAARARRLSRGQAVLDRLSHRAPAVADRPRALRPERRPSAARRRRLQAGAPRQQRPRRSTASACARAARWSPRPRSRDASSPTA